MRLIKAATITLSTGLLIFIVMIIPLIAVNVSPFIYTALHGNKETEKLYAVYKMASSGTELSRVINYANISKLEYIEYPSDNIITLHGQTEDHVETIIIWHKNGVTTSARFENF
ncbi:MAG: hypothetical protein OEZ38_15010 [Gammaproteobacteria bacterium]|nr:hypothetical protein [Gammaproteobacteria bacterium]